MVREPSPLPNYHLTQINQRSRSASRLPLLSVSVSGDPDCLARPLAFKLSRVNPADDDMPELSPLCRSIVDGTHQAAKPRSRDDGGISDLVTRIAKLEAAHKRAAKKSTAAVSRKDFEFAIETIGMFVGKELDPIVQRIEKLEAQSSGVKWAGAWHDGMRCAEGELITDRGSLWLCTSPTHDRPGDNASAFRLIVKNGFTATDGVKRHATSIRN